jgi:hypothetical protein
MIHQPSRLQEEGGAKFLNSPGVFSGLSSTKSHKASEAFSQFQLDLEPKVGIMARRFFNKEHHFNTPRLEDMGRLRPICVIASPKALICFLYYRKAF